MPALADARCPACSTPVPPGAKFCPRCGVPAPAVAARRPTAAPTDLGKLPAPIPLVGVVFLVALVVGPAAIIAGTMTGSSFLLYGGIAVAVGIVVLLLLGLLF